MEEQYTYKCEVCDVLRLKTEVEIKSKGTVWYCRVCEQDTDHTQIEGAQVPPCPECSSVDVFFKDENEAECDACGWTGSLT